MVVERLTELENEEYPFVHRYKCKCGEKTDLYTVDKPDKLIECFDCLIKHEIGDFD